jgi:two-component system response regulator AtoC
MSDLSRETAPKGARARTNGAAPPAVLLVDDESTIRLALSRMLAGHGWRPLTARDGAEGISLFIADRPSVVLLDLRMPGMSGLDALKEMRRIDDTVPVIIISAHGDIPAAVEAIKLGAYDFIAKEPDFDKLMVLLKRAVEARDLRSMVKRLNAEVLTSVGSVLGRSEAIRNVAAQIHQIAHSDFSVFIQGDTGTGKSYIARMIHDLSARAGGPFVPVDVGAIPDTLMESELFGFERGAFTGADHRKPGYFERAGGGTLFIDELQNMPPAMQGKLLAAVEERRFHRLGGVEQVNVDIRIICATNGDIMTMVHNGRIREDLYFRLGEIVFVLPPLRDRTKDIRFLAERFLHEAVADLKRSEVSLSDGAVDVLEAYPWPGNIRELKNVVRRAALVAEGQVIEPRHLNFPSVRRGDGGNGSPSQETERPEEELDLAVVERKTIIAALRSTQGNKTRAASLLGIDYKTILRKIKKYGISV